VAVQGAFIAAGQSFDAFAAVGKVLSTAKSDVLMIDPYADATVLWDYAVAAPEQVSVRVLADAAHPQPSLKPAAERWMKQFGPTRPLTVAAPEQVSVRVLADAAHPQPSLKPAAERWMKQFGPTRPLSVRLAAARTLHDRAILVDRTTAWTLGQSFKDLVARAHTTLSRLDREQGALKIAAYEDMWAAATPL
jgi:hypothetical protein